LLLKNKTNQLFFSFDILPTGQKQNRKRKKRKGEREIEKSKGKTLKKIQGKKKNSERITL
jgi:hypothetical protein